MGGNQSQESATSSTIVAASSNSSGVSGSGSNHGAISVQSTTSTREVEQSNSSISTPPIISSILSNSIDNSPSEQLSRTREEERGREDEEEEDDSVLMAFHTILARSLHEVGEGPQLGEGTRSRSGNTHRGEGEEMERLRDSVEHREHSSSHQSRPRHHHHHEGTSHPRQGNGGDRRRRRRHNPEEVDQSSDPLGFELGISWAALNERLRALQGQESAGGGRRSGGPSSSGNGRHGSRPHRSRTAGSLFFFRSSEIRSTCPFCKNDFLTAELDDHSVLCMTKPRVKYNEDQLLLDSEECSICLEAMMKGDVIARLPCLCIYHLGCLKKWYEKSQTCPEHPEVYNT